MFSQGTSLSSASATRLYRMGLWSVSRNMRSFTSFPGRVAEYRPTGILTRPKLIEPFQMARGITKPPCTGNVALPMKTPTRKEQRRCSRQPNRREGALDFIERKYQFLCRHGNVHEAAAS